MHQVENAHICSGIASHQSKSLTVILKKGFEISWYKITATIRYLKMFLVCLEDDFKAIGRPTAMPIKKTTFTQCIGSDNENNSAGIFNENSSIGMFNFVLLLYQQLSPQS